jgi:O-antigen/teichoic acid export membrane protein
MQRVPVASAVAGYLRTAIGRNLVLVTNSGSVAIGSLTTAALGFVYWWLAARSFPPEAVGAASALISMMGLMGHLGEVGLGTLLVGETLRHTGREHGLIVAALLAALGASAAFGAISFVLAESLLGPVGKVADDSALAGPLFIGGCAITGFALVLDQAFVGLLRSTLQMYRNGVFSLVKLLLLAATTFGIFALSAETAILLTWVAGLAASILVLGALACRKRVVIPRPPDFGLLSLLVPKVINHHLLNLATQASGLILPLLVSVLLSPKVNAAFYPGWMIVNIALLVPAALTTVLYTVGGADPRTVAQRLMFSAGTSIVFALATGIFLFLFSQVVLGVFNPVYPEIAGSSLQFLGFGVLGIAVKFHYIALVRLRNQMRKATVYFALGGLLELASAAAGSQVGGLQGLTLGWVAAVFIQAALMLKPILDVGRGERNVADNGAQSSLRAIEINPPRERARAP